MKATQVQAPKPAAPASVSNSLVQASGANSNDRANQPPKKHHKAGEVQDMFLNLIRKEHIPVSIYLVNGIKLQGQIESFDQYAILLRNTVTQLVYKHAISTVMPGRAVNFQAAEP